LSARGKKEKSAFAGIAYTFTRGAELDISFLSVSMSAPAASRDRARKTYAVLKEPVKSRMKPVR
jgi:hypothetical protein